MYFHRFVRIALSSDQFMFIFGYSVSAYEISVATDFPENAGTRLTPST